MSFTENCAPSPSGFLLNVTETFSGGAWSVAPWAGLLDSAVSCASAGAENPSNAAAKTEVPSRTLSNWRRMDRMGGLLL
ncbi:MAG: hypothetical protein NVS2B15_12650 [Pseudarthrobacter sp.]